MKLYSGEVHNYKEELVHSFYPGSGDEYLGILYGEEREESPIDEPGVISIDKSNNIVIGDSVKNRVVILNSNFDVVESYEDKALVSSSLTLVNFSDKVVYGVSASSRHFILNKFNSFSKEILIPYNSSSKRETSTIFTENVIFSYLGNGSIVSFVLKDIDSLVYSEMLDSEDTRNLFNNKSKYGLDNYTIDEQDRIFFNGKIQNKDYKILYNYWKENKKYVSKTKVPGVPSFRDLENIDAIYQGEDLDENTYWYLSKATIVFNKYGTVLDYFIYNNRPVATSTVDSKGNVYYLSRGKKDGEVVLNLYKITRQW